MLDVFWAFEKQQIIDVYGNFHILIKDVSDKEAAAVSGRVDIDATSEYMEFDGTAMNARPVEIATAESVVMMYGSDSA